MKKITILLLLIATALLFADFTQYYEFERPEVIEKGDYSVLNYQNSRNFGNEGEPFIPLYSAELLLPQNQVLKAVKLINVEYYDNIENIRLQPAGKQLPLSSKNVKEYVPIENSQIYNSQEYPAEIVRNIDTQFLSGHSVGSFSFCPVVYYPNQNLVLPVKSVEFQIVTESSANAFEAGRFLKKNKLIVNRLQNIVDNPNMLYAYNYPSGKDGEEYDLLLITSAELLNGFSDYLTYKRNTGYSVKTITVSDIYSQYSGADDQEKIRNCIIDYYENHDVSYVILGGDSAPNSSADDIIPHRGFYADVSSYTDYDIPSDMYYGYLDGTWNDDGDNRWGEPDEADLLAEVHVGRICVSDLEQLENNLNKEFMYQDTPVVEDISKALMVGEYLWTNTYGGQYKNEVYQGSSANGYTTEGVSDNFSVSTLYEMDSIWTKYQLFAQFNQTGINILNHDGHSSTDYVMKIFNPDVNTTNFTNDGVERGYVIGYSQGCYAGSFDNRDINAGSYIDDESIAEYLTNIPTAEVAFIANSRYGWGMQGSTNGASQYFDREFFDAIFAEEITQIGLANDDSKEDNISYINENSVIRWCAYELTLFGDPTLDIWTNTPTDIVAEYPASIPIGSSSMQITTDTPFSRIGLMQENELVGRAVTDQFGDAELEFFQPVDSGMPLQISIIGHNKNRLQDEIVVVSDQPYVIYEAAQFNDENENDMVEYNEDVTIDLTLWNVGNQIANNVEANLICADEYINIYDTTENYGTIDAESTMILTDAFAFSVADDVPDEHTVQFDLVVTGEAKDVWNSHFNLTVYAPILEIGDMVVTDADGDNDGVLDPGETAELQIPVTNIGHSQSPTATATIICSDEGITIAETTAELGAIAVAGTETAIYTISADESIVIGTPISLSFAVEAGAYGVSTEFGHSIGLIFDDFESGDFSKFDWQFAGDAEYVISTESYEGEFCAQTGDIGASSTTSLIIEMDVLANGELSFWKKVSCEDDSNDNWDYFAFFIDGIEQDRWDGEVAWSEETYEIQAGNHTFEWKYRKDGYVDSGSDCAWIDYIIFPAVIPSFPPQIGCDITEIEMQMGTNTTETTSFELSNTGGGTLEYSIYLGNPEEKDKGITDSYLECDAEEFEPGDIATWHLSAFNASTDNEWIQDINITLPVGVTLENATNFETEGNTLVWDEQTGNGVTTSWNEGDIFTQDFAEADIDVSIDPSYQGDIVIPYTLSGNEYGSPPHQIEGEIVVESVGDLLTWISIEPMQGNLNGGETQDINVTFDTVDMEVGTYGCQIVIEGNGMQQIVPVTLNVVQTANEPTLPAITKLKSNYPNPFNPETTINFSLKEAGPVELAIYNIKGQKIKTLVNEILPAQNYNIVWNGRDDNNQQVSSGVYFYRMHTPTYTSTRKMILMK